MEKENFRQDLFFRLNVIPFEVPPLRERREDIPQLVDYFLELFRQRYGQSKKRIQPPAMQRLSSYHWPGNVRELKNTVERLVIMVRGEKVTVLDLPFSVIDGSVKIRPGFPSSWQEARKDFERRFLIEKLVENEGNISRTARAIGMERTHLHRKLKLYSIQVK